MSYETKAGVAVSCSFLCLVGVVLSSKLWEGQAANAGSPAGQESVQVADAGAKPQFNIDSLFKNDDDPFKSKAQMDDAGGKQSLPNSSAPPPDFKLPQTGGTPLAQ